MAKQLNVKLNFQADTSQVQQALSQLTTSLSQIANITPLSGDKLTSDLAIAKKSAQELQMHLNNAFNVKTGNLDLGKLDASLKSSGQNLGQLSANLLKAGSSGEQAFLNIQRAIGNASVQINQANGALAQFMTTLKNTARWQISSSVLHGFMGALQSAWGYAKDLDKSLNSIRIVTGYSSDKMAEFAEQANKAAKSLSTTTTKYTDASLIFYQQGLSDEEVQKRTDITIKMANAAGQSAEIVSDQLTAVWNNFYDGSKSLEYYADVMTALGAATASSTDEIAGGLEKFAAIGETIGLSFEYAASALATITSNTRQSEEVVGTALKTIFARIQGLKLGESLEDGTDLNKYSEALQKVGISIFEQNGELKAMDNILDEMAAKWDVLSKAQQTALAQTVAGIRQYTQLIALMENWDNGDNDSMMANLETSYGSEGALQEQADIYADSWQAAVDRVKAASEDIYRDLFPTEKLTGLMDGIAVILEGVDGLVQAFGGLQGILLLVSSVLMTTFQSQIGASIDNIIEKVGGGLKTAFSNVSSTVNEVRDGTIKWHEGINQIFGRIGNVITSTSQLKHNLQEVSEHTQDTSAQAAIMKDNMQKGVSSTLQMSMEMTQAAIKAKDMSAAFKQYNTNLMEINNTQAVIEQSSQHLTKEQQQQLALLQEQAQAANEQLLTAQNTLALEKQRQETLLSSGGDQVKDLDRFNVSSVDVGKTAFTSDLMNTDANQKLVQPMLEAYGVSKNLGESWASTNIQLDSYKNHLAIAFDESVDLVEINNEANNAYKTMVEASEEVAAAQKQWPEGGEDYEKTLRSISQRLKETKGFSGEVAKSFLGHKRSAKSIANGIMEATKHTKAFATATGSSSKHLAQIEGGVKTIREQIINTTTAGENFKNKMSQVGQALTNSLNSAMSIGNVMSSMASGFSSIAMGISSISNAIDTLSDEDASFTTKLTAGAMAATMGIRGLTAGIGMLNTFIKSATTAANLKKAADLAGAAASKIAAGANEDEATSELANLLVTKLNVKEKHAKKKASLMVKAAQNGETGATLKDTIANYANVASQAAKYWYISLIIVAIGALIGLVYALATAEDAETKALQQAQDALKQSTEDYENAKQAVEDFKSALSNYNDGVEGLKSLTGNTNELREAVEEVNKKARELIETYGLFNDFTYGSFGEIIIDPDALAEVEKALTDQEKLIKHQKYLDEINVAKAQQNIDTKESISEAQKQYKYTTAKEYIEEEYAGTPTKKYTGTTYNPSEVDSRGYRSSDPVSGQTEQTGIEKIETQLTENELKGLARAVKETKEKLGDVPLETHHLIAAIQESADHYGLSNTAMLDLSSIINNETIFSLQDFSDKLYSATDAVEYYAQQIAKDTVEEQYGETYKKLATDADGNFNAQLYELMLNAGAKEAKDSVKDENDNTLEQRLDEIDTSKATSNANMKKYKDKNGKAYDIDDDKDLGKTYAADYLGWDPDDISYSSGTGEGTLTNLKTGDEITIEDEIMRERLAKVGQQQQIEKEFADATQQQMADFNKAMSNVVNNAKNNAITTEILDAAGTDQKIDYSNLVHQLSPEDLIEMNEGGTTQEEIMAKLGLSDSDLDALGLEHGKDFLTGFSKAMAEYDAQEFYANMATQARSAAISEATAEGFSEEESADLGEYATHLMQIAKESDELADSLIEDAETAADLSVQIGKMNRGIDTLADNFKDWKDILKNSSKESQEYSKALQGTQEALADVLDVEEQFISDDFVTEHLEEIGKAATGDAAAIDSLRAALAEQIVLDIAGVDKLSDLPTTLQDALKQMETAVANADLDVGEKISLDGENLDTTGFIDACNNIVSAAGMSVEEAQAYFDSLGYTPEFEMTNVTETAPMYGKRVFTEDPVIAYAGEGLLKYPYIAEMTTREEQVYMGEQEQNFVVPALNPDGSPKIRSVTKKATGSFNNYSSSNKGGKSPGSKSGGGSKKEPKKTSEARGKKEDIVDRYKEINDELEQTQRLMKKNDILSEGLWGAKKIAKMKENIKLMEQEHQQLKQKYELSKQYLAQDQAALNKAASEAGLSFTYEDGAITNYTEQMTALFNQREALLDSFGATMDENEEKRLEEFDKKVDALKEAYELYEKTLDEKQDMEEEHLQQILDMQQEYFDMLTHELEVKITLDDSALETLDYYLGKTEDDFYQRAEAMGIMMQQQGVSQSKLQGYEEHMLDLEEAHTTINPATGETYINDEQYTTAMLENKSNIIAELQALQELDKQMMHYYGETLAAAGEEIDKVTSRMEHQTAVLDHYQIMLDLMGKSTDYQAVGKVLAGKAETTKNEMEAARKEFDLYSKEANEKYGLWQEALASGNTAAAELYQQQYEDALTAADEAQEEYLSKAEAYAESLKAILENSLNEYAQSLENALTGNTSFDQMNAKLERAASLQEEYLTTTNKIYETNKLMNQAQQEIDKTSNTVAKRKLKSFIDETNQLQQQGKLSQFELEIQQAKYDLLLAEIALEEAQYAKSTVRLQRDSEGNFGYVYTADQDQIAAAQQELADKQNSLYNIALEGANGYAEKYMSTLNEMYDTLTDLQQQYLSGAFESEEEYHNAVTAAKEYYYAKLEEYSDLHSIAIAADTRVIEDAWSSEFNTMINSTEIWKKKVNEYVDETTQAFRDWDEDMDTIAGEMGLGGDLGGLEKAVSDVTKESEELSIELDNVIGKIETEIEAVDDATATYATHRAEILATISAYEGLIAVIDKKTQAENQENEAKEEEAEDQQKDDNKNGNSSDNPPKLAYGSMVKVKSGTRWYYDSYGTSPTGTARDGTIRYINEKGSHQYNIDGLGWIKKTDIVGYDTGGYTGEWGSYGKMAWLHEKELILNSQDTENFLSSIELLDNIVKTIDLQAANSQLGGLLKSPSFGNLLQQQQTLEQNVKIEASFPNVQNRTEIEEAFETLVNRASQYANRK